LDKNVRIGDNVIIRPFPRNTDIDNEKWYVRDGIVVIPKDVEIASGTKILPE
jgi:glucose-1-phosphate adenylyltransferase